MSLTDPQEILDAYSLAATDYVKHLGETLLGWKGVQVNVIINYAINDLVIMKGGPTVEAILSIGPEDKDFKKVLYDIAKTAVRAWNPVITPNGHKVITKKGEKAVNRKGEVAFLIPMKFCKVSSFKSVTIKGPGDTSVTVEDHTGRKLESDLLFEARLKLSQLLEWDNRDEE